MNSTPFSQMATTFRGHILRTWILQHAGTQAEKSAVITDAAISLGFINRSRPVPGTAMATWILKPEKIPLWAAQTALTLMLNIGWIPRDNMEWCGMAALIFRSNKTMALEQMVLTLPDSIDKQTAMGWLAAAIEEDAHYRTSRKTR